VTTPLDFVTTLRQLVNYIIRIYGAMFEALAFCC